ncbi:hypothetical protein BJF83_22435 [Nocardiopsis sp. CNR-923]|uniref:hypothetical protein n=1 Tax=Nocardiopsis sp. CNR-923 TaxID=1904965 RepID=UPI0009595CA9|nr:hypothetical protein [Nocardiopsis sp. CNR-923]OLT25842.1 hypothetical protein BJF83_22435 [Nocardiopsis sp. CNR-923]
MTRADIRTIVDLDVPDQGRFEVPTMTVRIRLRAAESPWGSGRCSPVIRPVIIDTLCPRCGGLRGQARNLNQHEDGAWYSVDVWDNPCGHVDRYESVAEEAEKREVVDLVCPVCEHTAFDEGEVFQVRGSSRWASAVLVDHLARHEPLDLAEHIIGGRR